MGKKADVRIQMYVEIFLALNNGFKTEALRLL